jgi:putative nucleotidyltransferase with HDIG domain
MSVVLTDITRFPIFIGISYNINKKIIVYLEVYKLRKIYENYNINSAQIIKDYKSKLDYRINFEQEMNQITALLTKNDNNNINRVLARLGKITHSNRVYIFEFKDGLNIMDNTYEWCAEGTEAQIDYLTDLESKMFPWWMENLKKNKPIIIDNVAKIPEIGKNEKEILEEQLIKSVLVIPIYNNELIGFMGFDDTESVRKWSAEDVQLLNAASNLILSYWNKINQQQELIKTNMQLRETVDSIIDTLANITVERDPYTKQHCSRVSEISIKIAEMMGFDRKRLSILKTGAQLHDIGKINVPKSILFKPGSLTELEFEMVKKHPEMGYEIIKEIKFNKKIKKIVLQHHERNDGSGYPYGLKEDEILLESKIIAAADVFESMISHRAYRPALKVSEAVEFICDNRGNYFDPEVVDFLLELIEKNEFDFLFN